MGRNPMALPQLPPSGKSAQGHLAAGRYFVVSVEGKDRIGARRVVQIPAASPEAANAIADQYADLRNILRGLRKSEQAYNLAVISRWVQGCINRLRAEEAPTEGLIPGYILVSQINDIISGNHSALFTPENPNKNRHASTDDWVEWSMLIISAEALHKRGLSIPKAFEGALDLADSAMKRLCPGEKILDFFPGSERAPPNAKARDCSAAAAKKNRFLERAKERRSKLTRGTVPGGRDGLIAKMYKEDHARIHRAEGLTDDEYSEHLLSLAYEAAETLVRFLLFRPGSKVGQ